MKDKTKDWAELGHSFGPLIFSSPTPSSTNTSFIVEVHGISYQVGFISVMQGVFKHKINQYTLPH